MASMSGPGSDSHDDGQSVATAWQAPLNSIILLLTAMDMRLRRQTSGSTF